MGYRGSARTTRRAVAEAKESLRAGRRRVYRPWIPERGAWLQFDWGEGPSVVGRTTLLFCVWLAWSKFRGAAVGQIILAPLEPKLDTAVQRLAHRCP